MGPPNSRLRGPDLLIAIAAVAICAVLGYLGQPYWPWSVALSSALVLRRFSPTIFAAVTMTVAGARYVVADGLLFPGDLVLLVAIHALAAHGPPAARRVGVPIALACVLGLLAAARTGTSVSEKLLAGGLVLAATLATWSIGLVHHHRAVALRHAQERAAYLERDNTQLARLAVHDERVRISREMHDVIAHALASVVAQAEGGRMAARQAPGIAGPLFDQIAETGRQALGDVKTLLRVVDEGAEDTGPVPTLRDLPALIDRARASGLALTHDTVGAPRELPAGLSLAVYRVIQESITNVLRHAPGARAALAVHWGRTDLTVSMTNTVGHPPTAASTPGRGLTGIQQRCALFGATMSTGTDTDTFALTTRWPLRTPGAIP